MSFVVVERSIMSRRNVGVGVALGAFAAACGLMPLWYTMRLSAQGKNLMQQKEPLSGDQVIRGAYVNTGSRDAGVDPDWDFKEMKWKGKRAKAPREPAPREE